MNAIYNQISQDILLPDQFLEIGTSTPDRLYAWAIDDDNHGVSLQPITWGKLLNDSERAARYLLGSGISPRTPGDAHLVCVAILAKSSYWVFVYEIAIFLLGWTPLLFSEKNNFTTLEYLISSAVMVVVDEDYYVSAQKLQTSFPSLKICRLEEQLLNNYKPWSRALTSFEQVSKEKSSVALYLHTSGSTGPPKLIPLSHYSLIVYASIGMGVGNKYNGHTIYGPLPIAHGLALCIYILYPLGSSVLPVFVTGRSPLTAPVVLSHVQKLPSPSMILLPPVLLENVVHLGSSALQVLSNCKRVIYAGAPLQSLTANALLDAGVKLVTGYGMSEAAVLITMDIVAENLQDNWMYIRFLDNFDLHFIPLDQEKSLFKLVIGRGSTGLQPAVINHENPLGFHTNDLWVPHPYDPNLWRHAGRQDDVIALSNGLKVNTRDIEIHLTADPLIAQAIAFGAGRFAVGVLAAPTSAYLNTHEFVSSIWTTIQKVNSILPKYAKLLRGMIIIAKDNKPFLLTDKGSVKRTETLELYSQEIDHAYQALEEAKIPSEHRIHQTSHIPFDNVLSVVKQTVNNVAGSEIPTTANFFDRGFDSLGALDIRIACIDQFEEQLGHSISLPLLVAYEHPTIIKLATFIYHLISGDVTAIEGQRNAQVEKFQSLEEQFSAAFVQKRRQLSFISDHNDCTVLITGTTGSLGGHILSCLLKYPQVSRIYCLNRLSPGSAVTDRQRDMFNQFGLPLSPLNTESKSIRFIQGDLSLDTLGLEPEIFMNLRAEVTHIIHVAWQMNFNFKIESFENVSIAGVHHLMDFALSSTRANYPTFTFISSIGVAGVSSTPVPERMIPNENASTIQTGYSQAKFIAERLIEQAAKDTGVPCNIIRCGQISGSTKNGAWNINEYIPILLRSSKQIGLIPESFSDIRWVPVDFAADAISQIALGPGISSNDSSVSYWHIEAPLSQPWSLVMENMIRTSDHVIKPVTLRHWLDTVVERASANVQPGLLPAVKLIDFFSQYDSHAGAALPVLETISTRTTWPQINLENGIQWIDKYIAYILSY
ncbi:hypothetical protein GYMLUDRAFT_265017 [Collybiopsis luxurians FD-317 M1]|uniref:Carrier domain-containing protein n=1 Tax=Collybiopsis luxurians FD-317 M1 TaxID=944289 RepID=A0A0D0CF14_9AGAR|nr:hypothetical protein GYMLUDRAFT_265017 [Collybiopsis luxurians FD-317 M1]